MAKEGYVAYTIEIQKTTEDILKAQAKREGRSKRKQIEHLVLQEEKKFNQKKKS